MIHSMKNDQFEPNTFNQALMLAVKNDNPSNVGKMILKGAYNITEAMKCSMDEKKYQALGLCFYLLMLPQRGSAGWSSRCLGK